MLGMPNALSSWLQRKLSRQNKPTYLLPPTLPSQRPGQLTPSTSCEDLVSSSITAQVESSFFQKLPVEIRRAILIEAFGGRTVHMDVSYDHPPLDDADMRDHFYMPHPPHGDVKVSWKGRAPAFIVDETQPKRWIWRSSVCHRNPPSHTVQLVQPGEDDCRFGWNKHGCKFWPGEYPSKCCIGAMGWLLSCRQAYAEGIDILYSTNTIHTTSREMMMHIDQILVPKRLASIRSVELTWEFDPYPKYRGVPDFGPLSDMASFRAFLKAIPTMFPNVRSLHVSLRGFIAPSKVENGNTVSDNRIERVDEDIVLPLDAMARTLGPHIHDFSVGIPSSLYRDQRDRAKEAGWTVEQECNRQEERHWRPLEGSSNFSGYWVKLGEKDMRMPYVCTMGEGMGNLIKDENKVFYNYYKY